MKNINKINQILKMIVRSSDSDLSSYEITIGKGVVTPYGTKVEETKDGGNFIEVKLYYECDVPNDILGRTQELIYKSFVIGPDRTLYRFNGSDGQTSYYKPGGFGGFTAIESMHILGIMNYVEEGGDK